MRLLSFDPPRRDVPIGALQFVNFWFPIYVFFFPILRTGWWSYKQIMSGVDFLNRAFSWFKGKIIKFIHEHQPSFLSQTVDCFSTSWSVSQWPNWLRHLQSFSGGHVCHVCHVWYGHVSWIVCIYIYIIHLSLGKLMTIHFHREFSIVIILYRYTIMDSNYGMDDPTHKT